MKFSELQLNANVLEALDAMRFDECTPIQEQAIPIILEGKDLIAVAQTGTGKTAAFLLPVLNKLSEGKHPEDAINCVIMSPTRELAQQIDQQMEGFSYFMPVSSVAVYGGNDGILFEQQKKGLTLGADVVIATPGRLIAHLSLGYVDLSKVSYFILDEADRMLDMGFYEDIMQIAKYLPKERQTIMFSATMPAKIQQLANTILNNPSEIKLAVSKPAEKIIQAAYVCYENQKLGIIRSLFMDEVPERVIVFASSKIKVKEVAKALKSMKLNVGEMHSDLEQAQRETVMHEFKAGRINILVATDIVARGIDIDDIRLVINFDVPHDSEDYVHRIGRTARANCLKQLTEQETALKVTQRLYENARMAVGKDVKALRRQLQEGEACPVCGSTAHPYHQEQEVVDTLFRSIEQEYNVASTNYQQMNNRSIALQRDLAHQKTVDGQIAEQLAALYKAGIEAGNEEQIQHRLAELAIRILEYRNLYAEWQRSDEEIKKMRAHCEALRENVSLCRLAMQKVSSAKEQLVILQNAASAELKRFEVIEKALNVLRQERSQLLKGKSADEAEAAVAKREKELNLALEKARKEVEAVHNRLSGLQGEMKQIALAIGELQEQYKKIESPELLPEIIKKQQEENLNIERALSTMEARLLQQAKNKLTVEQIAKELAEKQTVAERWAKLNKLIGSADGAKFKVIAQSYTLNLLLLHANQHLSYLSKRYKLQQVPDTLALQVIDCDMCDEIRTVYSLSGGESFLISLALALGLSSLSSNNLKVESLFIDEGFGSLDAESLRTAMEALEQLQMQGRKIGVISHVQEMSERISVQVQVHKKVNGKSVLTVVG